MTWFLGMENSQYPSGKFTAQVFRRRKDINVPFLGLERKKPLNVEQSPCRKLHDFPQAALIFRVILQPVADCCVV